MLFRFPFAFLCLCLCFWCSRWSRNPTGLQLVTTTVIAHFSNSNDSLCVRERCCSRHSGHTQRLPEWCPHPQPRPQPSPRQQSLSWTIILLPPKMIQWSKLLPQPVPLLPRLVACLSPRPKPRRLTHSGLPPPPSRTPDLYHAADPAADSEIEAAPAACSAHEASHVASVDSPPAAPTPLFIRIRTFSEGRKCGASPIQGTAASLCRHGRVPG